MKTLEFQTSKGKFKLIDMPETIRINGWNGSIMIDEVNQISQEKYAKGFYLKNITEEQASEIVDINRLVGDKLAYKDYLSFRYLYKTTDSLYSLFDSKGIHLFENPYKNHQDKDLETWYEELTFYNPYIFKL